LLRGGDPPPTRPGHRRPRTIADPGSSRPCVFVKNRAARA
jgi:hypothetical protein